MDFSVEILIEALHELAGKSVSIQTKNARDVVAGRCNSQNNYRF